MDEEEEEARFARKDFRYMNENCTLAVDLRPQSRHCILMTSRETQRASPPPPRRPVSAKVETFKRRISSKVALS